MITKFCVYWLDQ